MTESPRPVTAGLSGAAALEAPIAALAARLEEPPRSILVISRNDLEPAEALARRFPGARVTRWIKADFQGQRAFAVLAKLRAAHYDLFLLHDRRELLDALEDLYRVAAIGARARRRFLLGATLEGGRLAGEWRLEEVRPLAALPGLGARLLKETLTAVPLIAATPLLLDAVPARSAPRRFARRTSYDIAYLRTDLSLGVKAGGSVSHTSGVAGGLLEAGHRLRFLAPEPLPDLDPVRMPLTPIPPGRAVRVFDEAAMVAYHHRFNREAERLLRARLPDVLYQRHSVFNASGAVLARRLDRPLILEANGSEVWAREKWSRLQLRSVCVRMERYAFAGAAVIIVVSKILKEQLVEMGADPDRILVNPNGVDPERFRPDLDGSRVRAALGFGPDDLVCGFLGTFTRWHGVLFLAEQVAELARRHPRSRFLFMGDGDLRSAVEARLRESGVAGSAVFTGLLDHGAVPEHLAACDVLISPHLPFEDGTPFFGSPTKLFEYLAMGRAVVASRLGQIGDVIEPGTSGCLYTPGSATEFQSEMDNVLRSNELRHSLGVGARARVLAHYTWRRNADRAIGFLEERLAESGTFPERSET